MKISLDGNLASDGQRGFDYDDENQLIRITLTNGWKTEFTYHGRPRRRIRKEFTWSGGAWLQTSEVHYVFDNNAVIQKRDGNNLPRITYTRGIGLGGRPLGRRERRAPRKDGQRRANPSLSPTISTCG